MDKKIPDIRVTLEKSNETVKIYEGDVTIGWTGGLTKNGVEGTGYCVGERRPGDLESVLARLLAEIIHTDSESFEEQRKRWGTFKTQFLENLLELALEDVVKDEDCEVDGGSDE